MNENRHAVERDRWDVEDWTDTRAAIRPLRKLEERLEEVSYAAPTVVADVHQLLARPAPRLVDPSDLRPGFRVNREVVGKLEDSDALRQLRQHTVGDAFAAGLATSQMEGSLTELYQELAPVQEAADEADKAADEYDDACDDAGVEPGSPEAQANDALEQLAQAAEAAADALDAALGDMGPVIERRVREAAEAAAEDAETTNAAASGWGLDPGELSSLDPATRLALTERLTTPRMLRLAELFGRLRSEMWAQTSRRWDQGPDEIADVTLGDDLNLLLSSELLGLCEPELEIDFLDRYDRKQLLQYELRTRAKEAKGSVIYVRDSSDSMFNPSDAPDLFAAALGLVLLDVARQQRRGFRAVVFGSVGQTRSFDFGDDASQASLTERLAFAEFTFTRAGTAFEGPLDVAAEFLADEFERTGKTTGDIVFATDGTAKVQPEWLDAWDAKREALGFRCYGLTIGMDSYGSIEAVSDFVTPVYRLLDGGDIGDVFNAVTKTKENA